MGALSREGLQAPFSCGNVAKNVGLSRVATLTLHFPKVSHGQPIETSQNIAFGVDDAVILDGVVVFKGGCRGTIGQSQFF